MSGKRSQNIFVLSKYCTEMKQCSIFLSLALLFQTQCIYMLQNGQGLTASSAEPSDKADFTHPPAAILLTAS